MKALLEREMSRKEFLQFLGSSLVVLFGLSNFVNLLQRTAHPTHIQNSGEARGGFGSRKFGS